MFVVVFLSFLPFFFIFLITRGKPQTPKIQLKFTKIFKREDKARDGEMLLEIARIPTRHAASVKNSRAGKGQGRWGGHVKEEIRKSGEGRGVLSGARRDGWTVTQGKLLWGWEMYQALRENQILAPPPEMGKGIIKTRLQRKWCTNGIFSRNRLIKCRWNPSNWKMLLITWGTSSSVG